MKRATAVLAFLVACQSGARAGPESSPTRQDQPTRESGRRGRWVVVGIPIAYHFTGDSVQMLMYPPQAPRMTYRVEGRTLEMESEGKPRSQAFAFRGDTLDLAWGANGGSTPFTRVGPPRQDTSSIEGTWRALGPQIMVLTFRSDRVVVMEVGPPVESRVRGDTMVMIMQGQVFRTLLRGGGDVLHLRQLGQVGPNGQVKEQKLVRRPWGCFGIPQIDGSARECR